MLKKEIEYSLLVFHGRWQQMEEERNETINFSTLFDHCISGGTIFLGPYISWGTIILGHYIQGTQYLVGQYFGRSLYSGTQYLVGQYFGRALYSGTQYLAMHYFPRHYIREGTIFRGHHISRHYITISVKTQLIRILWYQQLIWVAMLVNRNIFLFESKQT